MGMRHALHMVWLSSRNKGYGNYMEILVALKYIGHARYQVMNTTWSRLIGSYKGWLLQN